jgi:hypothetical protein
MRWILFSLHNHSSALWPCARFTLRNEYQKYSREVKGGRSVRLTLPPSVSRVYSESVGSSMSQNPMGIHGLLQGYFTFLAFHSSMALQPYLGPWALLRFRNLFYTDGRTPWTCDQPVARPLHTHRINAHTNIHALRGIRTHDPSFRANEDSSCLRPRGPNLVHPLKFYKEHIPIVCNISSP